jgi:uncharacterized protein YkwD
MAGMNALRFVLLVLCCWSAVLPAALAQDSDAQLMAALSEGRSLGCGANTQLSALRPSTELDEAARRIARGQDAMQAARSAGYRATRIFHAKFSGYESVAAVAQTMRERYCAELADPELREAGVHHAGDTWWIVLAASYDETLLADASVVVRRVLALTNEARSMPRRCGTREFPPAPPLAANVLLERAAQAHASDMATNDFVEHQGSDGSTAAQRLTRVGYRWRDVGENIAAGQVSPEAVMQAWLKSPEHCANIMEPAFTEIGVAFGADAQSSAGIHWVQVFARPR